MSEPAPPEWSFLGVNLMHFAAGAVGGWIRGLSRPEQHWRRRAAASIIGAFVAGYGTPVVAPIAASYLATDGVTTANVAGLTGFLLGLAGLSLCEGIIRFARRWRANPKITIGLGEE